MSNQRFSSLISGPPRTDHLRVSDAERQAVADRLAQHYGEGRLDQIELDERVGRAMGAKTRADLNGLFDDLPDPGGAAGSWPTAGSGPTGAPGRPDRRARREMGRSRRHGLLPIVAIVVVALIAAQAIHALLWITVPWLLLGAVAVIALAATGHLGHHGSSRPGE